MDEQPVKRKRGRPRKENKAPPPQYYDVLAKGQVVVDGANERGRKGNTALTTPRPVTVKTMDGGEAGGAVPELISACLAIRQTVNIDDPITLNNAMGQYIQLCSVSGMKISNSMLYFSCNITRTMVYDWLHGRTKKNNPEYKRFAMLVKEVCSAAREQYGLEGQVNPILTIFHQKYYDGFSDTPQIDETTDPLGENQDPAKLAEKYKDIILD